MIYTVYLQLHPFASFCRQGLRYHQKLLQRTALKRCYACSMQQASTEHVPKLVFHATEEEYNDGLLPIHSSRCWSIQRIAASMEQSRAEVEASRYRCGNRWSESAC